jgi:hypothetical protein
MWLNYYDSRKRLNQVEVVQKCPGCGQMRNLTMRSKVNSYAHDLKEWYVGCNCGWLGPTAANPTLAAVKWEAKAIIVGRGAVQA